MKRLENETQAQYRARRINADKESKAKLRPKLLWNSGLNGAYCRKIHGDIGNV